MKRRFLCGLLSAALLACTTPAQATRTSVPVQIDGERLQAVSYLESGVTYVPMRAFLEDLGNWSIWWDAGAGEAAAVCGTTALRADPAADTVTIQGKTYSGKVWVENGRTYIPLRTVITALGGQVEWDRYMSGAAVTSPGAEHDASDLYWLSRIIHAEAQGEPLTGKTAVGNVVMNRVESTDFPSTIPGVIFDRVNGVQFQPTANGAIFNTPSEKSLDAARQALNGVKPVGESLYFYAPALSQGAWITANRVYYTTIGGHRFYL